MARRVSSDCVLFTRPRFLRGVELACATYRERTFPVHAHDAYVVGTVVAGTEQLLAGGATHLVSIGDVLRLHPDESHANRSLGLETLSYIVFYLPHASIVPYLDDDRRPISFPSPVRKTPSLACKLIEVHKFLRCGPQEKLAQECAMLALVRALTAGEHASSRPAANRNSIVRRARLWIDEHFAQNFGLADLASVVDLSVFRLAHLFKESTG